MYKKLFLTILRPKYFTHFAVQYFSSNWNVVCSWASQGSMDAAAIEFVQPTSTLRTASSTQLTAQQYTEYNTVRTLRKKNGSSNKIVWLTIFGWFHKTFWLSRPNFCPVNQTRLLKSTKVFAWIVFLTLPNILLIEPNVLVKYIK